MKAARRMLLICGVVALTAAVACGKKTPPVARPLPPPPAIRSGRQRRGRRLPPEPVAEPTIVPPEPVRDDAISSASLDDLNRNSPLKPVFFEIRQRRAERRAAQRRSTRTPRC